jgi:hypothetical protein
MPVVLIGRVLRCDQWTALFGACLRRWKEPSLGCRLDLAPVEAKLELGRHEFSRRHAAPGIGKTKCAGSSLRYRPACGPCPQFANAKMKRTPFVPVRGIPAHFISRPCGGARSSGRGRAERLCLTSPNVNGAAILQPGQSMRRSGLAIGGGRKMAPGGEARIQRFGRTKTECQCLGRHF